MRQRIFATASLLAAGFALTAAPVLAEQAAHFGGSAQLDYQEAFRERDRQTMLRGLNTEIAFRIETDVHDRLSFTGKVCYGCHGFELDQASLEARPHPLANLQVGRLPVPFGEFSLRHDPTSHNLPTKPIAYEMGRMARYGPSEFNLGVLPVPYVDNAAVFFGNKWAGISQFIQQKSGG